ncbi:MAG: hypothetical protein LBU37_03535 [Tannerellaceae bacterium]|jgi:outer membrane protein OmpA-like peptidoglycan-associated protein|nr:hypothetical protein [Tannerellaceae bacterium]
MIKNKKESFFWTSYSDLMMSLFFVMLLLFVLVIVLLHNKIGEQALKLEEFEKIEEIKKSLNNIDSTYFAYNPDYKKHILKISVNFPTGKSNINDIDYSTLQELQKAGRAVKNQIDEITKTNPEIQYLLIIEGQASKDNYVQNYELSYERALALNRFWQNSGIDFGKNCEVLISGSGTGGSMRERIESKNQRFLIHIIPKTGVIESRSTTLAN